MSSFIATLDQDGLEGHTIWPENLAEILYRQICEHTAKLNSTNTFACISFSGWGFGMARKVARLDLDKFITQYYQGKLTIAPT